jgi:glycosyltransferase involved in cell wall biosynthesis
MKEHPNMDTTPFGDRLGEKETGISLVVPVLNEESTIVTLFDEIDAALNGIGRSDYEVVFVDDGSRDDSWARMQELADRHPEHVVAIKLRRNFGKAAALSAGIAATRGEVIFTMDADLQDHPGEIPRFLEKLEAGYDMVAGWKRQRHDPFSKTAPSKLFNAVTGRLSGLDLHDFNCGFKAARGEVFRNLRLYGELHRFIPVMAHDLGYRVGEIEVEHRPREFGTSKYGWERYARGFLDLLTVLAITRYAGRPGHLFGGIGIVFGLVGGGTLVYLTLLKLFTDALIGQRPLLIFGALMVILSVQMISLGLLAELVMRNRPREERQLEIQTVVDTRKPNGDA